MEVEVEVEVEQVCVTITPPTHSHPETLTPYYNLLLSAGFRSNYFSKGMMWRLSMMKKADCSDR